MENREDEVLKPKNTWELLRWMVYEPGLFEEYSGELKNWKVRISVLSKLLAQLGLISIVLYFIVGLSLSFTNWPNLYPNEFNPKLVLLWSNSWLSNFQNYVQLTIVFYSLWLGVGLGCGLVLGFPLLSIGKIRFGLHFGLYMGIIFGIASCLIPSFFVDTEPLDGSENKTLILSMILAMSLGISLSYTNVLKFKIYSCLIMSCFFL